MFIRSIRFKIILLYMFVLALTLLLFSVTMYHKLHRQLLENLDDVLQSRAEGIASSIDTYWEVERLEAGENEAEMRRMSKIDNLNFIKIAQRWVEERSSDPILMGITVQICDMKGKPLASSRNIFDVSAFPEPVLSRLAQGSVYFDNTFLELQKGKKDFFREMFLPVVERDRLAYIVRVVRPLDAVRNPLGHLQMILIVLVPLTVLATGLVGLLLTRVALGPVDKIIQTIHQITAENLKMRIIIPETRDEIQRLAGTFNEMLSRLEAAFASQRQFIEDLTHELKTPLSVLKGELEVTLKKMRSPQEYASILHSSLEEVDRIAKISGDLLLLARFDSATVPLEMRPLDLGRAVKGVCDDVGILARQKSLDLVVASPDEVVVLGDESKLKRLFLNLIENAIKYTHAGRIEISVSRDNEMARVMVRDTGAGIPPEDLPHVFDRFYRVDKSRSLPGFGLGLSIAKSVVTAHKGRITVESVVGQGTTFCVFLPLAAIQRMS